jgi:TonB-linked SusC/RagA family outer membrane protein
MKKFLLAHVLVALCFLGAQAQSRVITGKVTSMEDGSSLPGVAVILKGTQTGTATIADGTFSLSVPGDNAVLQFSFLGFVTQEISVGARSVIDVQLSPDTQLLSEIVVTAVGVQREKRALGYGVATVGEELIANRPENDIGRILQGKVAGVNITSTGGVSGSGTNIVIRGYSSITQSNQPLFVVDGVPFNSNTNQQQGFTTGGQSTTSRFLDLDPNNIESINVLKGLSATVLYGDQGRNGVILITTKSGGSKKKAAEVNLVQSVFSNNIASLPNYQNNYGGGFHQNIGFFFSNWGPHFSEVDKIRHPIDALGDASLRNQFPEYHGNFDYDYRAYDDPGKAFFRTGLIKNTSLSISGRTDKTGYSASFGYSDEQGFTPGNDLKKYNFGIGVNSSITEKLSVNSSFTFAITDMVTPPINAGFGSNSLNGIPSIFANVLYTPRSVDLANLPFEAPADNRSVYFRSGNDIINPKWVAKYMANSSFTQRFFNSTSLNYDISDSFSLIYRLGLDTYTETQEVRLNKGGGGGVGAAVNSGLYRTVDINNTIWNQDVILTFNKEINPDLNLTVKGGFNSRYDSYRQSGIESQQQLAFDLFRHSNFITNAQYRNFTEEQQRMGVYGDISLDYKNFLYLNLAGRNDWTSTLEEANRSIFYPGVSVSFIPTTAFPNLQSDALNYLKLRVGTGSSAGFPLPYSTRNVLGQNARGFVDVSGSPVTTQTIDNFLGNPNLNPELIQELELGVEGRFLKNRIGLDLSAYERNTKDLITRAPLDPSTGFTSTFINIGNVRTRGLEISLNGTIYQAPSGFKWDAIFNWSAYRSIVTELSDELDEVLIDGFTDLGNFAIKGRPFNIIKGVGIQRDANGNKVVSATGQYLATGENVELGDPNPEWTSALINNFSYKGFTLSFMLEKRYGGMIFSTTAFSLVGRGVTSDTDHDRSLTMILPGVKQDGTPNDIMVTSSNYFFDNFFFTDEAGMFDGSTIRLREVSLSYALPRNLMSRTPFKGASLTVSGTNLWFNAYNMPKHVNFDTDVLSLGVGNGLGFDYLTGPSSRRFGATLNLTF